MSKETVGLYSMLKQHMKVVLLRHFTEQRNKTVDGIFFQKSNLSYL